jgi:EAL domain-containing protein (putative c-di-GMP-specific phosphodiesterase class I)
MAQTDGARAMIRNDGRKPSSEYLLLDYLQRIGRDREAYNAIQIHLSRLRPLARQPHHVRVATATFETQLGAIDGRLFTLGNDDLFLVYRNRALEDIDNAVASVARLFAADPLTDADGGAIFGRFFSGFELARDFIELLELVKRLHRDRERSRAISSADLSANAKPLEPSQLARLDSFLKQSDLSSMIRSQAICTVSPGNLSAQVIMRELYISIADLQQTMLPDHDLAANLWLFQYLTQTLDQRMLYLLVRNQDSALNKSFSINLNIDSVLSQAFLDFDKALPEAKRRTVVIEFQKIDIFGDFQAFLFARDFVRERGYRICLDGLDQYTLSLFDREALGLDLVKIYWSPAMADDPTGTQLPKMQAAVDLLGRSRAVLCRCDSEDAVRFGQSLGITIFQGRFIDSLLRK